MRTRTAVAAVCMFLGASIAAAQEEPVLQQAVAPAGAPRTVGEIIQRHKDQRRASIISVEWSGDSFVIPVAGNAQGGGGTFFKSDIMFNNDRLADQRIAVGWLAQGQNNCSAPLTYFSLTANSVTAVNDFVATNLNKTGIGAILVTAVDAAGALDESAEIDGYSRIWTPQPGSTGTVSQNFTAIDVNDSIGSLPATLMGLKQSAQFRTNVGVVNFDTVPHTWSFRSIFTGATTSVTVPGCSMSQVGAAGGSGSALGNVAFTVTSDGFGFWWSGFGSSTDNVTGDGWVSRAIQ